MRRKSETSETPSERKTLRKVGKVWGKWGRLCLFVFVADVVFPIPAPSLFLPSPWGVRRIEARAAKVRCAGRDLDARPGNLGRARNGNAVREKGETRNFLLENWALMKHAVTPASRLFFFFLWVCAKASFPRRMSKAVYTACLITPVPFMGTLSDGRVRRG